MTPTPKEQAKQLVNEYYSLISGIELNYISKLIVLPNGDSYYETAKMCAKKAVDLIINSEPRNPSNVDWDDVGGTHQYYYEEEREEALKYFQEVKKEIQQL